MDPVACWTELQAALKDRDREATHDNAEALADWLRAGGFVNLTSPMFRATPFNHRDQVRRYCEDLARATAPSNRDEE